jgi:hypothetical protein
MPPYLQRQVDFLVAGLAVGAMGDVSLQIADKLGLGNEGLKSYFANQSSLSAVARAAALTGTWGFLYGEVFRPNLCSFLIFSAGLDVVYRKYHKELGFEDLGDYYAKTSPGATILYNVCAGFLVYNFALDRFDIHI